MLDYQVAIIGSGPAGLTAGLYAKRACLNTVILEKNFIGGLVATTYKIANYPGFPEEITGADLTDRMRTQVENLGVPFVMEEVEKITPVGNIFKLKLPQKELNVGSVIITSGAYPAKLNIQGENRLQGRGVSYCATCDGAFFRDKKLVVIGGGDSAIEEAAFLTRFASKVSIVHRRDELRAQKFIQEEAFNNPKMDFIWDSIPLEIHGDKKVEKITLKNVKTGEVSTKDIDGIFIYVGLRPASAFISELIRLDDNKFIITDEDMRTSCRGIFAAGDVRHKSVRQISTAVGDGAVAALSAQKYLNEQGD